MAVYRRFDLLNAISEVSMYQAVSRRTLALAALPGLLCHPLAAAESGPRVHAITGARVVVAPGDVIENGSVVIRDGVIESVGANVSPPPDARIWPGEGLTVYPGLIDAYVEEAKGGDERGSGSEASQRPGASAEPAPRGAEHELAAVRAQYRVAEQAAPRPDWVRKLREAGFASIHLVPSRGVLRGTGAVIGLSDGSLGESVIRQTDQLIAFESSRGAYPGSRMGAIALVRQSFLEARWYAERLEAWRRGEQRERPPLDLALEALWPVLQRQHGVGFAVEDVLAALRAADVAREAGVDAWLVDAGDGYKRAAALAEAGLPVVAPLAFPAAPKLEQPGDEADVETATLRHWQRAPGNPAALRAAGLDVALSSHGLEAPGETRAAVARAIAAGLSEVDALAGLTTVPARLLGLEERLGTLAPGKLAYLTVVKGSLFEPGDALESVWVAGRRHAPDDAVGGKARAAAAEKDEPAEEKKEQPRPVPVPRVAGDPEAWRATAPAQPAALLVRGATIWTSGPEGTLENADLLVRAGRIEAVGAGLEAPAGAEVIDATGLHVTAGLIDAHSHAALSGVNECTNSVTAEVRMRDTIDSESISIYRLLAGGNTIQHLLHGSCNAIGGQSALIKNRWGEDPEGLLFEGAPPTIKFALGENPKRAGGSDRYPRSRMGVEQVIRDAFLRARDYTAALEEHARGEAPPPRPSLQLDAVAEILSGERAIHSHSYRQSEILMLMRTAEDFDVRVRCFQHILEGYKVADEMAAHGACASGFSDWWAYKFEVYDAIPYNAFLMWERGVSVSLNSDSEELARRLNTEAAKAVKYGGVPPEEALRFVTLNPAQQLGIDDRVGSLEPGKDADFVIWSGSPLSTLSRAEQTWIDGRRYFDRQADLAGRAALLEERTALLESARSAEGEPKGKGSRGGRRPGEESR